MATRASKEGEAKPKAPISDKSAPAASDNVDVIVSKVGEKIAVLRKKKRLSLQALADISGVAPATIHKVERSGMVPTITTLLKLATALGVTVGYFVEEDENASAPFQFTPVDQRQPIYTPHQGLSLGSISGSYQQFVTAAAVATVAPGASSGDRILNHTGEELIFLLSGEVVFRMQDKEHVLKTGDALHFQGGVPHQWENRAKEPAQLIWYVFRNREND